MNKRKGNNKYSWIQYFFWLVAGCEINILKGCPTDFNKQAAIGLIIVMTSLFAAGSGCYAAYYFTQHNLAASLWFAPFWGVFIFSLDRMMVVTLKKSSQNGPLYLLKHFLIRALIAGLIAYVISIPVELLIFSDGIDANMYKYKSDLVLDQMARTGKIKQINQLEKAHGDDSVALRRAKEALNMHVPLHDPQYSALQASCQSAQKLTDRWQSRLGNYSTMANDSSDPARQDRYRRLAEAAKTSLRESQARLFAARKVLETYLRSWRNSQDQQYQVAQNNEQRSRDTLRNGITAVGAAGATQDARIREKDSFILRYLVLKKMAEETNKEGSATAFMLWIIRSFFFTVEILPTLVKIVMPMGCYDRQMLKVEKETSS